MKKFDLTIACLLWGNWCDPFGEEYVEKLFNSVERNLTLPFRFVCIIDDLGRIKHNKIDLIKLDVPDFWRWNLKKMFLYKKDNGLEGRVLAIDLDTVITGNIDELASYSGKFCVLRDFYQTDLAGGGLISFKAGEMEETLYSPLLSNYKKIENQTQGAERKYYRTKLNDPDYWQDLYHGKLINYKINKNKGPNLEILPNGIRMVCFHGTPRPHQIVNDVEWVQKHWR